MIRPFTLISMILAAASGAYLFAVKHHAQVLENQIASVSQASRLDAQRIRVLQAQWALETDPTRLQQLASQFTVLKPMQPAQLVSLAALRTDLPAPGSAPPAANPELPGLAAPELVAAAQPWTDAGVVMVAGLPLPPPQAPVPTQPATPAPAFRIAAAAPRPASAAPHPVHVVRHPAGTPGSILAEARMADALPPPRPYAPPHIFAPPAVQASALRPAAPAFIPVAAPIRPAPPATPPAPEESGSALGMAANLPPPQPLPQGAEN
jgi:hypothetical protein